MGRCQWFWGALWTRLRREGSEGKVLRIDRPDGRKVLKFDGPSGRGLWYRPAGDEYEVSVTGFTFSVIWHEKHSAELSAFGRYTPYPAVPDFPRKRGQNKSLYAFLQRHGSMAKHP